MPAFTVSVERITVHTAEIDVTAKDEDEASTRAESICQDGSTRIDWELESEDFDVREVNEE